MTARLRSVSLALGLALAAVPPGWARAQELAPAHRTALAEAEALDATIAELSAELWNLSETAMLETRSAELLAGFLEGEGFRVERGVAGMPTAFVAEFGSGSPVVGVLAEYDALPGVGNAAVPERRERDDGHQHGQGCGHNLFGAGSVGAAVAIRRAMERHGLAGTVRLYGTPAEETVVGKVYMARDGLFDDLDAALEWHPDFETGVLNQTGMAMNNFTVEFFGQAAHGAFDPWNGRSALDAVELMNDAVNMMREHIEPTARIHYVIPAGGEAPNVVPEYARVWYYVRDVSRDKVERNYAWLMDIVEGAALATRTESRVTLTTGVHAYLLNRPLQEAAQRNLERVGAPSWNPADQAFARRIQAFLGADSVGLSTSVRPLAPEPGPLSGGSTDVAEVSRIAPTVGLQVATAGAGLPWHSWATSASHGTPGAPKAAQVAARALALTGMDVLTDPELVRAARAAHREAMGGQPYRSPLPEGQPPPVPDGGSSGTRR